jgi:hypothetical protein
MSPATKSRTHTDTHASDSEVACENEFPTDDAFHLLQNHRRRAAIRYLRDKDEPVEMRDLAEQVAAWENETTVQALTSEERQRAYIPLYQSHLPNLNEGKIIEYDQNRGIVEKTPFASLLERYLTVGQNPRYRAG